MFWVFLICEKDHLKPTSPQFYLKTTANAGPRRGSSHGSQVAQIADGLLEKSEVTAQNLDLCLDEPSRCDGGRGLKPTN